MNYPQHKGLPLIDMSSIKPGEVFYIKVGTGDTMKMALVSLISAEFHNHEIEDDWSCKERGLGCLSFADDNLDACRNCTYWTMGIELKVHPDDNVIYRTWRETQHE